MARRFLGGQRSYPGLVELFEAFYGSILGRNPAPVAPANLLGTVRICERVAKELAAFADRIRPTTALTQGPRVVLTGGTGFLGRALAAALVRRGQQVIVVARRAPPAWEQVAGVDYAVADLGRPLPTELFAGASLVVHAAAETAGGWEQHQRNSIDSTGHVLRAAALAGVHRVVFVGSVAVLARPAGGAPVRDDTPLEPDSRGSGPYVWGKLESERLARTLGGDLGLDVKVVRPGAIVDYADFDPPGRLGKRVGNIFVAVGSPAQRLGVVGLGYCADAIAWVAEQFEDAPSVVNLLDPALPTKRDLVRRLREQNPDVSVLWLPTLLLHPLSWAAMLLQKLLRPGRPAINVAKVFSVQAIDTTGSAELAGRMRAAHCLSAVDR
jgi:nucleoside-diphosphate-sugar epimerase